MIYITTNKSEMVIYRVHWDIFTKSVNFLEIIKVIGQDVNHPSRKIWYTQIYLKNYYPEGM